MYADGDFPTLGLSLVSSCSSLVHSLLLIGRGVIGGMEVDPIKRASKLGKLCDQCFLSGENRNN